jgi:hypothetical protein
MLNLLFILTNKLNFKQIFNYYKTFSLEQDYDINLISWNNIKNILIQIQWSNYYGGGHVLLKKLDFDYLFIYKKLNN